jgi:hypothetical protein
MAQSIDLKLLDKRTAERYIAMGLLDEKEWEKHLKSLDDLADKAQPIETIMSEDEDYDDEDEDEESEEEA